MATTETTNVILTLAYEDSTSRNVTFSGVEDKDVANVKTRVKSLNANLPESFKETFVSANGYKCRMISKAQIVTTEEEVIYSV